jgi:hypothetical protein
MTTTTVADPEAPYGRRLDGTPKRRTGRPPGARNKTPRTSPGNAVGRSPYEKVVVTSSDPEPLDEPDEAPPLPAGDQGDDLGRDPVSSIGAGLLGGAAATSSPSRGTAGRSGAGRPTVAIRKDIRGKIAFIAGLQATVWEMRDPWCGKAFKADVPQLSDALTDIICDSPDLVAWFTSGGNYMKWLNVVTALQGTGMAMWRHHIVHSVGEEHGAGNRFDPRQYPAVVPNTATG